MSKKKWNSYCYHLMADDRLSGCVIASYDGTIWGQNHLYATPGEVRQIINGFTYDGCEQIKERGLKIMGNRYWIKSCDNETVRGVRGQYGFTAYKANTCVVLGTWDATISHGMATNRVEGMGSYIKANGF